MKEHEWRDMEKIFKNIEFGKIPESSRLPCVTTDFNQSTNRPTCVIDDDIYRIAEKQYSRVLEIYDMRMRGLLPTVKIGYTYTKPNQIDLVGRNLLTIKKLDV